MTQIRVVMTLESTSHHIWRFFYRLVLDASPCLSRQRGDRLLWTRSCTQMQVVTRDDAFGRLLDLRTRRQHDDSSPKHRHVRGGDCWRRSSGHRSLHHHQTTSKNSRHERQIDTCECELSCTLLVIIMFRDEQSAFQRLLMRAKNSSCRWSRRR